MNPSSAETAAPSAVIIIGGSVNYYYDLIGQRIGEALRNLGFTVEVCTLRTYREHDYDWCFLLPLTEVCMGYNNIEEGMARIAHVMARAGRTASVLLECVQTGWFESQLPLLRQAAVPLLIDLGFHNQWAQLPAAIQEELGPRYRFLMNGLTRAEREAAQRILATPNVRPIPWAFIGHLESNRVQLIQRLMAHLQPNGFVYMPKVSYITENGPHINRAQLQTTLEHTRYYVWCSHHDYFYMESERFRNALQAGATPIKIMQQPLDPNLDVPFRYLMLDDADFDTQLETLDFEAVRRRFIEDYGALPSLESELSALVEQTERLTSHA